MAQQGFFDLEERYRGLSRSGDVLEGLARTVPWENFRKALDKALKRSKREKGGRKPYDCVLMFKVLVLQALYNMSDEQTEYQLRDRLSFMRFLGIDLHGSIPDARTIWLFRETLMEADAVEALFEKFDGYLAEHGFKASGGQIIDASMVPIPKQRNDRDENALIKKGETPVGWSDKKKAHKDVQARWALKDGKAYYGYKNHLNVDVKHKLIRRYDVTPASVYDIHVLEGILDPGNRSRDVYADTAYRSGEKETRLKQMGYRSRIQYRGCHHLPLSKKQEELNRRRSRIRRRVEHVFGHMVTAMRGCMVRTIGLHRARAKIGLKNLAYNLYRFTYLSTKAAPA
jgi:transposase, IS5 family